MRGGRREWKGREKIGMDRRKGREREGYLAPTVICKSRRL